MRLQTSLDQRVDQFRAVSMPPIAAAIAAGFPVVEEEDEDVVDAEEVVHAQEIAKRWKVKMAKEVLLLHTEVVDEVADQCGDVTTTAGHRAVAAPTALVAPQGVKRMKKEWKGIRARVALAVADITEVTMDQEVVTVAVEAEAGVVEGSEEVVEEKVEAEEVAVAPKGTRKVEITVMLPLLEIRARLNLKPPPQHRSSPPQLQRPRATDKLQSKELDRAFSPRFKIGSK